MSINVYNKFHLIYYLLIILGISFFHLPPKCYLSVLYFLRIDELYSFTETNIYIYIYIYMCVCVYVHIYCIVSRAKYKLMVS